nr:NADPH-dependent oxidoreductase [Arboricoccus pini]
MLPASNDVIACLFAHRSVRAFRPNPVPDDVLTTLVAAAQSAPTSSNLQAWSVVAVGDEDRKARLAALAGHQNHVREAPLFLVWLADLARAARIGEAEGRPVDATAYLETTLLAVIDAALAAQNAVVAAESLGLGSVYIGGIRNDPAAVAAELGLPPMVFPVVGLALGYPDPARPAAIKPRLPQHAVLHRERYDHEADAGLADYEDRLRAFQRGQGMAEGAWRAQVAARLAGPQSMAGRHLLRAAFERLGFALR